MANPNRSGIGADWVEIGCTMYMGLIITINAKLAMKTRHWTWITHLLTYLSVLTLFIFYYLYGIAFPVYHLEGTGNMADIAVGLIGSRALPSSIHVADPPFIPLQVRVFSLPQFWLVGCLLVPILSLLPDFTYDMYVRLLFPKPYVIYQEKEEMEEAKSNVVRELGLGQR